MSDRGDASGHRPTIRDVAERAGLSTSLVWPVLRGEPMVRDDECRRVHRAAEEHLLPPRLVTRHSSDASPASRSRSTSPDEPAGHHLR